MPEPAPLVLASTSPRRIAFLRALGIRFVRVPPRTEETARGDESARGLVRRLALAKAREVAARRPAAYVVAADTVVELDGAVLGKPSGPAAAERMLARLSGRWHRVRSGLALVCRGRGVECVGVSTTRVRFRPTTAAERKWYAATGEGLDKAGAYAIQGRGAVFVERIVGSPSNVVGFPLELFVRLLDEAGLSFARLVGGARR